MPIDLMALFVAVPVVLLSIGFVIALRRSAEADPDEPTVAEIDESFQLYTRATWIVTIALVVVFTSTGFQLAHQGFDAGIFSAILGSAGDWGYSPGFRMFIGASQIVASAALLFPRTATWAAGYLTIVMAGALYTQIAVGAYLLALYPVVLLAGLAFVAYERYLWRKKAPSAERERSVEDHALPPPLR